MKRLLPFALLAATLCAQTPKISSYRVDANGEPIETVSGYAGAFVSNDTTFDSGFRLGERGGNASIVAGVDKDFGHGIHAFGDAWFNYSVMRDYTQKIEGPREFDLTAGVRKEFNSGRLAGSSAEIGGKNWDYLHQFEPNTNWPTNQVIYGKISYPSWWNARVDVSYHHLLMRDAKDGHQVAMTVSRDFVLSNFNDYKVTVSPQVGVVVVKDFFDTSAIPSRYGGGVESSLTRENIKYFLDFELSDVTSKISRPGDKPIVKLGFQYNF